MSPGDPSDATWPPREIQCNLLRSSADATLDLGARKQPLFIVARVEELKRLPLRKAATPINPML
jgi:hypothetical protein